MHRACCKRSKWSRGREWRSERRKLQFEREGIFVLSCLVFSAACTYILSLESTRSTLITFVPYCYPSSPVQSHSIATTRKLDSHRNTRLHSTHSTLIAFSHGSTCYPPNPQELLDQVERQAYHQDSRYISTSLPSNSILPLPPSPSSTSTTLLNQIRW